MHGLRRLTAGVAGPPWVTRLVRFLGVLLILHTVVVEIIAMRAGAGSGFIVAAAAFVRYGAGAASVDVGWYPPRPGVINNLTHVLTTSGVYGFVYNSSYPADVPYGTYNWCNMPHVRREEYVRPPDEYVLRYVEIIHRHHKRTVYAANAFPAESDAWDCSDAGLFFYGQPAAGNRSAHTYWRGYRSPTNPFVPPGFAGTCQFPQLTAGGLDDAYQHGKDLYAVYHDLLGFLPDEVSESIEFRVTQNVITSQVAGMVINGMFGTVENVELLVGPSGYDSLEPTYPCSAAEDISSAQHRSPAWQAHLTATSPLFSALDAITGVPPSDPGFHASIDHYHDNLSARQCHGKPLPCSGANSSACVTQALADAVYRLGHWEYAFRHRASPASLAAAVGSFGVWLAELAAHFRARVAASSPVVFRHSVAHDGSVARLLALLQADPMVWPGMGAELVFELYQNPAADAYFVRVLFGGRVLRSDSPLLRSLHLAPLRAVLDYVDGLVGPAAALLPGKCNGSIPL